MTSCLARVLIGTTCSLLLCFVLDSLAALIHLQVVQELCNSFEQVQNLSDPHELPRVMLRCQNYVLRPK